LNFSSGFNVAGLFCAIEKFERITIEKIIIVTKKHFLIKFIILYFSYSDCNNRN
jgi:hypothetical protein